MGIEITANKNNDEDLIAEDAADDYYFYACVRANPDGAADGNDEGAWAISSGQKFTRKPPAAPSSVRAAAGDPATTSVKLTWSAVSAADTYDVEWSMQSDFASTEARSDRPFQTVNIRSRTSTQARSTTSASDPPPLMSEGMDGTLRVLGGVRPARPQISERSQRPRILRLALSALPLGASGGGIGVAAGSSTEVLIWS